MNVPAFEHEALRASHGMPLVYTAMSKHLFYFRMHISKFVLEQGFVPLNPFMITEYFLLDTVDRNLVRAANNSLVHRADEIWVFGPVSNGVLAEIKQARERNIPVKFFRIDNSHEIVPIAIEEIEMENDVIEFKSELHM